MKSSTMTERKFNKGDRVQFTEAWLNSDHGKPIKQKQGTVVGFSNVIKNCSYVQFTAKGRSCYHNNFLELIPEQVASPAYMTRSEGTNFGLEMSIPASGIASDDPGHYSRIVKEVTAIIEKNSDEAIRLEAEYEMTNRYEIMDSKPNPLFKSY